MVLQMHDSGESKLQRQRQECFFVSFFRVSGVYFRSMYICSVIKIFGITSVSRMVVKRFAGDSDDAS